MTTPSANRDGAGEPLCGRCGERRAYAKPADVPLCKACWREDRGRLGIVCTVDGCQRAAEDRSMCATHARDARGTGLVGPLRTSGKVDPVTGRPLGLPGRPPDRLAGGQPGNASKSTPLSRWLRRGELKSPAIRRHVEQLGGELAASLGGASNLSAQQAMTLEHICLSRVAVLLALDEVAAHGAFGANTAGDRVASAGYASLVKSLAESRQQLGLVGLDRRAAPATSLSDYLQRRATGDLPPDAAIPGEVVAVVEQAELAAESVKVTEEGAEPLTEPAQ
jgi:hypothetical protein